MSCAETTSPDLIAQLSGALERCRNRLLIRGQCGLDDDVLDESRDLLAVIAARSDKTENTGLAGTARARQAPENTTKSPKGKQ